MPKLRDLIHDDREAELEELASKQELEARLHYVREELELYHHPAWPIFLARLIEEETHAIEALVTGDDPGARERVKVVRHLLAIPEDLERERARITADLSALEEE